MNSSGYKEKAIEQKKITQGFLNSAPERTVRVRILGDQGFLTVKGISKDGGLSRFEWEKEIPAREAESLLLLCEPGKIEKTRFKVKAGKHIFEVDEFYGDNEGLTIAEIELDEAEETFLKPSWLGEEVTGEKRYYNSQLARDPYKNWKNQFQ